MADAISSFCVPSDDYTPPSASLLLRKLRLADIYIEADASCNGRLEGGGDHKLGFNDDSDLVGGHDLFISITRDLQPMLAWFDG